MGDQQAPAVRRRPVPAAPRRPLAALAYPVLSGAAAFLAGLVLDTVLVRLGDGVLDGVSGARGPGVVSSACALAAAVVVALLVAHRRLGVLAAGAAVTGVAVQLALGRVPFGAHLLGTALGVAVAVLFWAVGQGPLTRVGARGPVRWRSSTLH
ncbi:hypothetical protein ABT160_12095 [Streptomyces sp. NPDC001941]|uniref:hypothetical protein n=1 Tax=Streptomyces sp. NPDC001941 TaxID=3154659 RepID=UPI003331CC81